MILHVANSFDSLLQVPFKTEFVTALKKMKEQGTQGKTTLKMVFQDKYVKAEQKRTNEITKSILGLNLSRTSQALELEKSAP